MLEFGLNTTYYGKVVLAACFVNDLATVLALGFKFSPFTIRHCVRRGKRRDIRDSPMARAAILQVYGGPPF